MQYTSHYTSLQAIKWQYSYYKNKNQVKNNMQLLHILVVPVPENTLNR